MHVELIHLYEQAYNKITTRSSSSRSSQLERQVLYLILLEIPILFDFPVLLSCHHKPQVDRNNVLLQ